MELSVSLTIRRVLGMGDILISCRQFVEEIDRIYPVLFAYLFGSRAKGTDNLMSDIDIAIMFVENYNAEDDLFNRGHIIDTGKEFFNEPVDVINLAKASLLQQYEVVQHGIVVVGKDSSKRLEFESLTLRKYFDFRFYSEHYNEAMISRIKEGTYFGGDSTG